MSQRALTIGQLAKITGLSAHTLRFYERVGLIDNVSRNDAGQRRYSLYHITWLEFVTRLRSTDMPIEDITHYRELMHAGGDTVQERLDILTNHRQNLADQLDLLQRNLRALDEKIALYKSLYLSEDVDEQPGNPWCLSLDSSKPTQAVQQLPEEIWTFLNAPSFLVGLESLLHGEFGWDWPAKYRFLYILDAIRQVLPHIEWGVSETRQQDDIFAFQLSTASQPQLPLNLVFYGNPIGLRDGDEVPPLPTSDFLVRIQDGLVVEAYIENEDAYWQWMDDIVAIAEAVTVG